LKTISKSLIAGFVPTQTAKVKGFFAISV